MTGEESKELVVLDSIFRRTVTNDGKAWVKVVCWSWYAVARQVAALEMLSCTLLCTVSMKPCTAFTSLARRYNNEGRYATHVAEKKKCNVDWAYLQSA